MDRLDTLQLIALAATLGWASGIRLYAVLFIVGGLGYLGWFELPEHLRILAHPLVLGASGFMVVVEFFADKIPGVDTVSGPGWSSMLTGVWADKHGVHDNSFKGANYAKHPHFFHWLHQAQRDVAGYAYQARAGISHSLIENRGLIVRVRATVTGHGHELSINADIEQHIAARRGDP